MPLYEYQCPLCQKVHEVMQKFSDAPMETCPDCKGPVTKLISMSSFALKGTGWYTTDYKRKSGPAAPSASSESANAGESSKVGESSKSGEISKAGVASAAPAAATSAPASATPASSSSGSGKSGDSKS